jgi:hypothetical protein
MPLTLIFFLRIDPMRSLPAAMASVIAVLTFTSAQAQTIFVTDFYQPSSILRVNSNTGASIPPPVTPGIILPSAMTYGPDGMLYATSQAIPPSPSIPSGVPGSITQINPTTGAALGTFYFTNGASPGGLAFAPNGDLYVSNFVDQTTAGTGTVQKYVIGGGVVSPVGTPVASGLNQPSAILFNGTNLYITETNVAATLGTPTSVPGGRLSVVDTASGTPTVQTLVTGTAFTGYAGIALSGNTLFYSDLFQGAIDRFNITTNTALGALVAPGGTLTNQFPGGLYVDSPSSILVADLGSHDPVFDPITGLPDQGNGNLRRYSTVTIDTQIGGNIVSGIYGGTVINAVPEPGTFALMGGTVVSFVAWRRRRAANS